MNQTCRMAGLLIGSISVAGVTADDKTLAPDRILSRTIARYSECTSYVDTGTATVTWSENGKDFRKQFGFTINFERKKHLRFRFGEPPTHYGADITPNYTKEFIFGISNEMGPEKGEYVLNGLRSATYFSSTSVPLLLINPDRLGSSFLLPRKGWVLDDKRESNNGYYKLKWENKSSARWISISKTDFCIRKIVLNDEGLPRIELQFRPTVFGIESTER